MDSFSAIPIKIQRCYFVDINKLIIKFIWRDKRYRLTNTILKEKQKMGEQTLLNFKTYYKGSIVKRRDKQ